MEVLKTIFVIGLYVAGILFALSLIFAVIGVWVDKITAPKRKKKALDDALVYLRELEKIAKNEEKSKKTTKKTTKKAVKDEEK